MCVIACVCVCVCDCVCVCECVCGRETCMCVPVRREAFRFLFITRLSCISKHCSSNTCDEGRSACPIFGCHPIRTNRVAGGEDLRTRLCVLVFEWRKPRSYLGNWETGASMWSSQRENESERHDSYQQQNYSTCIMHINTEPHTNKLCTPAYRCAL